MSRRKQRMKGKSKLRIVESPRAWDRVPGTTEGVVVRDYITGDTYTLGAPGVTVFAMNATQGDLAAVKANPHNFFAQVSVDLPFYLPLEDKVYPVQLREERVAFRHRTKKRGEEEFSTIDTSKLPYFSSLQLQTIAFADGPVTSEFDEEGAPGQLKSWVLILGLLKKLEEFLEPAAGIRLLDPIPVLSYRILFFPKGERNRIVAQSIYPYSSKIEIRDPQNQLKIDNKALQAFLSASFQFDQYAQTEILPGVEDKPFCQKVFLTIHDFCFYCRQHPTALSKLKEEQLRDLLLVVFKAIFTNAEGETFHSRGKLDFKVTNPDNKYEFVTGELKWWRGAAAAKEVYEQAVRTHASGQEAHVFCLMLSDRKDATKVHTEIVEAFQAEAESVPGSLTDQIIPTGSREFWRQIEVSIRGSRVPLTFGVADLYHAGSAST